MPFRSVYHMSWHFYHRSQIAHIRKDKHFFCFMFSDIFSSYICCFLRETLWFKIEKQNFKANAKCISISKRHVLHIDWKKCARWYAPNRKKNISQKRQYNKELRFIRLDWFINFKTILFELIYGLWTKCICISVNRMNFRSK